MPTRKDKDYLLKGKPVAALSLRLPQPLADKLAKVARAAGQSQSAWLRRQIEQADCIPAEKAA